MSIHYWGDEDFDWEGLGEAIRYLDRNLRRWRVGVTQSKEKYGEARIYCYLGLSDLHQLTHPGHAFRRWPWPLWRLNFSRPARGLAVILNQIFLPIHKFVYRWFYKRAVVKWPHLREEILHGADWDEFLEGL